MGKSTHYRHKTSRHETACWVDTADVSSCMHELKGKIDSRETVLVSQPQREHQHRELLQALS